MHVYIVCVWFMWYTCTMYMYMVRGVSGDHFALPYRMRTKWNEAVMNRRDFLDAEVRKLMDKKEPSVTDLEKQNELLDQWAMLQWQRQAVLQPKPGSGVPGAPTNWLVCSGSWLTATEFLLAEGCSYPCH